MGFKQWIVCSFQYIKSCIIPEFAQHAYSTVEAHFCLPYLFVSKYVFIKTPRYLTESVGTSLLPSNLNLKLWSVFSFLGLKITSSVFFILRFSLFALNQFDNLSSDDLDCIMLVLSANWYFVENLILLYRLFT